MLIPNPKTKFDSTRPQLFWPPKWPSLLLVPFNRAKKVSWPSQGLDFVPGPFSILEMAPASDFQGLISNYPVTFTTQ